MGIVRDEPLVKPTQSEETANVRDILKNGQFPNCIQFLGLNLNGGGGSENNETKRTATQSGRDGVSFFIQVPQERPQQG